MYGIFVKTKNSLVKLIYCIDLQLITKQCCPKGQGEYQLERGSAPRRPFYRRYYGPPPRGYYDGYGYGYQAGPPRGGPRRARGRGRGG